MISVSHSFWEEIDKKAKIINQVTIIGTEHSFKEDIIIIIKGKRV